MKDMDCTRFDKLLNAYLDGELRGKELENFENHRDSCPECAKKLDFATSLLENIADMDEEITMPLDCQAAWRSTIRRAARPQQQKRRAFGFARFAGYIAAAFVLVTLGASLQSGMLSSSPVPKATYSSGAAYSDYYETAVEESYSEYSYDDDTSLYSNSIALASDGESDVAIIADKAAAKKIIRNASRSIQTTQFEQDHKTIEDLVQEYDGYSESNSQYGNSPNRTASMTVKIPAEDLDAFLTSLDAIGTVTSASESTSDITSGYVDTEARLEAKRDRLKRLEELVAEAVDLEDLILLEDKQNELLYEIESLEAQLKSWDGQVTYSSVNINLTEVEDNTRVQPVDPSLGERAKEGFYNSLNSLSAFGQSALVALVAVVPQLIWIVPLAAIILLIVHFIRKRNR